MFEHYPSPVIFAHRGDLTYAPENTLPSFQQALQKGADGVELDAKLTADGQVIVIHDMTVDRTTTGKGRVASFKLDDIRKLDAGKWFDEKFNGTKVPMLAEVFELVGKDKLINIELTNYSTPRDGLVLKVCELIKRHNIQKQILFSSFLPSNLKIAAQALPEIPRGLLAMPGLVGLWARSFGFMFGEYQALHPHISSTSREQVQRVHRLNRRVHVWTANSPEEVNRLKEWGVDGIFTDDPQTAVRALGRSR
ncbi:glycerophosphodiester phosphodiesterase family protein [Candidatus Villigracilis affinis]|uniref:glycerophosphodiester phosphodiesterase n=1 Tax=Candidatus Villigracilis affinis TaxID=3140682 RepID=UPI001DD0F1AB|nr:glycerophosphodiester phosphodiesterase [Anaerolineales bacterium]